MTGSNTRKSRSLRSVSGCHSLAYAPCSDSIVPDNPARNLPAPLPGWKNPVESCHLWSFCALDRRDIPAGAPFDLSFCKPTAKFLKQNSNIAMQSFGTVAGGGVGEAWGGLAEGKDECITLSFGFGFYSRPFCLGEVELPDKSQLGRAK